MAWYHNATHKYDEDAEELHPGVFYVFGLGLFNGMFAVNFVLVDDPEYPVALGRGVNTTFDIVALINLFGR